jgi:hypothetical protein
MQAANAIIKGIVQVRYIKPLGIDTAQSADYAPSTLYEQIILLMCAPQDLIAWDRQCIIESTFHVSIKLIRNIHNTISLRFK